MRTRAKGFCRKRPPHSSNFDFPHESYLKAIHCGSPQLPSLAYVLFSFLVPNPLKTLQVFFPKKTTEWTETHARQAAWRCESELGTPAFPAPGQTAELPANAFDSRALSYAGRVPTMQPAHCWTFGLKRATSSKVHDDRVVIPAIACKRGDLSLQTRQAAKL